MPTFIPPLNPALHPVVQPFSPQHQCLAFAVAVGTPVVAAHAGRCAVLQPAAAGYTQLTPALHLRVCAGASVIVSNDRQHRTLYSPLGAAYVTNGEYVNAGQTIGCTTTNTIDGARLHFTLSVDNIAVDPLPLFAEPIARSPYTCTAPAGGVQVQV